MANKPFGEKLNLDKDGKITQTPLKTVGNVMELFGFLFVLYILCYYSVN